MVGGGGWARRAAPLFDSGAGNALKPASQTFPLKPAIGVQNKGIPSAVPSSRGETVVGPETTASPPQPPPASPKGKEDGRDAKTPISATKLKTGGASSDGVPDSKPVKEGNGEAATSSTSKPSSKHKGLEDGGKKEGKGREGGGVGGKEKDKDASISLGKRSTRPEGGPEEGAPETAPAKKSKVVFEKSSASSLPPPPQRKEGGKKEKEGGCREAKEKSSGGLVKKRGKKTDDASRLDASDSKPLKKGKGAEKKSSSSPSSSSSSSSSSSLPPAKGDKEGVESNKEARKSRNGVEKEEQRSSPPGESTGGKKRDGEGTGGIRQDGEGTGGKEKDVLSVGKAAAVLKALSSGKPRRIFQRRIEIKGSLKGSKDVIDKITGQSTGEVCVTITERTRDLLDDFAKATGLPSAKSKQYRAVCRATILDGILTLAEREAEKLPPFQPAVKEADGGSGSKEKEGDGAAGCKEKGDDGGSGSKEKEGDGAAGEAGGEKDDRANGLKLCKITIGSKDKGGRLDGTSLLLRMARLNETVPLAHSTNPGTFINTLVVSSLLQTDESSSNDASRQSEQRTHREKTRPPPILTQRDRTPPPPGDNSVGINGSALAVTPPRGTVDADAGLVAFSPHASNLWKTPRHLGDHASSLSQPEAAGGAGGGASSQGQREGPKTPVGQWLLGSELDKGVAAADRSASFQQPEPSERTNKAPSLPPLFQLPPITLSQPGGLADYTMEQLLAEVHRRGGKAGGAWPPKLVSRKVQTVKRRIKPIDLASLPGQNTRIAKVLGAGVFKRRRAISQGKLKEKKREAAITKADAMLNIPPPTPQSKKVMGSRSEVGEGARSSIGRAESSTGVLDLADAMLNLPSTPVHSSKGVLPLSNSAGAASAQGLDLGQVTPSMSAAADAMLKLSNPSVQGAVSSTTTTNSISSSSSSFLRTGSSSASASSNLVQPHSGVGRPCVSSRIVREREKLLDINNIIVSTPDGDKGDYAAAAAHTDNAGVGMHNNNTVVGMQTDNAVPAESRNMAVAVDDDGYTLHLGGETSAHVDEVIHHDDYDDELRLI